MPRETDANQAEIIAALRQVGASVYHVYRASVAGVPDLVVSRIGANGVARNYLLEVKTATGRLKRSQVEFRASWRGPIAVVRTVDEALRAIGVEVEA